MFSGLMLYAVSTRNANNITNNYGQMLARTTAARSADAAFNRDLIGMRAVLQDTTQYDKVRVATVHDVENQLLVQAGDFPYYQRKYDQSFTAPITQHDSIAGYATVIVSLPPIFPVEIITLLFLLVTVIFISATILIFRGGHVQFNWTKKMVRESLQTKFANYIPPESITKKTPLNANSITEDDLPTSSTMYPAFTLIHVKNIHVIKQQLNGENFRNTLKAMDSIVEDVMRLYGGLEYQWKGNHYQLKFGSRESQSEAVFHAICCAYLIIEIASIVNNVPIDIATLVSLNEQEDNDDPLPYSGLAITADAEEASSLGARLKLIDYGSENGQRLVSEFVQPYKGLLNNQREQLLDSSN